jgi:hypothetical protein
MILTFPDIRSPNAGYEYIVCFFQATFDGIINIVKARRDRYIAAPVKVAVLNFFHL